MDDGGNKSKKEHVKSVSGQKAAKLKKAKAKLASDDKSMRERNPRAFAIQNIGKTERRVRRKEDIKEKRRQLPQVDRTPIVPPPIVVAIVGPPKVGKSTLLKCLIKNFTRQNVTDIKGPVTIISGKQRRLTFIEVNNDINVMIDVAKVADLVLLMVDASFGFEMEVFEFLNICQTHGFPRVMGVMTHLDAFKKAKTLRSTKKVMKHRFWTEVYQGAKLFYLSGMVHGEYQKNEIHNLGRFISVMKFRPLAWRENHPYLLIDRMEDLTNAEEKRINPKCDRSASFYGYIRGSHLKQISKVHLPGIGDFSMKSISLLPDPCPFPETLKKRTLIEKEKTIYAPMSGVGGIVYDKDAVYIELGGSHSHNKDVDPSEPSNELVSSIINTGATIDEKIEESELRLFSSSAPMKSSEMNFDHLAQEVVADPKDGRRRRKVIFKDGNDDEGSEGDSDEDESDDDESDDNESDGDSDTEENIAESKQDAIKSKLNDALRSLSSVKKASGQDAEKDSGNSSDNFSGDSDSDNEDAEEWKSDLAQKASDAFYQRQSGTTSLRKIVYGKNNEDEDVSNNEANQDDDELGGLFKVINAQKKAKSSYGIDDMDCSKFAWSNLHDWESEETRASIKDCFVTGTWKESENAEALLKLDDMDDNELFGDFEDLETGDVHKASEKKEDDEEEDAPRVIVDEEEERKKRIEKKRALKMKFDANYDNAEGGEGQAYYDELKKEVDAQTMINRQEFEGLDDHLRVEYEGYRPGMYVRVEVDNVPCELIDLFDPNYPLVLGGLGPGEDQIGYVQCRLKKHRWYPKILKNRDQVIMSVGWRRFQTLPVFSVQDHNMRHRMIKYTPKHLHCDAHFWGPISPQGTGFLAVQSVSDSSANFRIAATGVILEMDKSTQVVKKLKLTGEPYQIFKKTAFIKGNSKSIFSRSERVFAHLCGYFFRDVH